MRAFSLGILASVVLCGTAAAQPPKEDPAPPDAALPDQICLTNACGAPLKAPPKSVREAIKAGSAFTVRDLGGSPKDAMDAINTRLAARQAAAPPDQRADAAEMVSNVMKFADTSDGSTLSFSNNTDFPVVGMQVVGSIEKRGPDGSLQTFWLTDNGGGVWVRPGYEPPRPRT